MKVVPIDVIERFAREVESQRHYEHCAAKRRLHPASAAQHSAKAQSLDLVHEWLADVLKEAS